MPKIDIAAVRQRKGSGYPPQFQGPCAERVRQRHWHSHEDEFVYILEGEVTLIENDGETVLRAGDCAAFPKNTGNGHHMINRSATTAVYLEVGSRHRDDITTCSDINMMSANADGRFTHKDGRPYPTR